MKSECTTLGCIADEQLADVDANEKTLTYLKLCYETSDSSHHISYFTFVVHCGLMSVFFHET